MNLKQFNNIGSSTSLPGGNQVDGLPPAPSLLEEKLRHWGIFKLGGDCAPPCSFASKTFCARAFS